MHIADVRRMAAQVLADAGAAEPRDAYAKQGNGELLVDVAR